MFNIKKKKPKILVVGDLMIDRYLWGNCNRISPEAPVQVIDIHKETNQLGGGGNVLNNLVSLDAKVAIMSVVGDDEGGKEIQAMLKKTDVKIEFLSAQKGRKSVQKNRVLASRQQIVRIDKESTEDISLKMQEQLLEVFDKIANNYEAILLSDYGKGVVTRKICAHIIKKANALNIPVLVDPKGSEYGKYKNATLLTPNKKEAYEAMGIEITDEKSLSEVIVRMKNELALQYSLITLSEEGIAFYDERLHVIPAIAREVYDVTGAGDTVLASLGYALACGVDIKESVSFANKAAAVVVGKVGSATVSFEEIEHYEHEKSIGKLEDRIKSKEELKEILDKSDKKIVFTNGCFDILHVGHAKYLKTAKTFGDILVVGLNADDSVRKLKGSKRPINTQIDRACMLSAFGFVDYVVIFEEETPYELISFLKPHILVKGADYEGKEVVGSDVVDEVRLVEFEAGKSTTKIIQRIENARDD